jgi:aryl sulfotransferase
LCSRGAAARILSGPSFVTERIERPLLRRSNFIEDSSRWEELKFRPDDIVISTPPRCGTSWVQMITALLVFQKPELPAPLTTLSPWLDVRLSAKCEVLADLEKQTHRRFIKTHTARWGIPISDGVTYICVGRDPRDVALSWDDHLGNADPAVSIARMVAAADTDGVDLPRLPDPPPEDLDQSARGKFWRWALDDTPPTSALSSLLSTLDHVQSFWDVRDADNTVLMHYHNLKADLEGQMRYLADRLGIEVPLQRWPVLVKAASFDEMRRRPSITAPEAGLYLDDAAFFKKARKGEWRDILNNELDLRRYGNRVAALASPDLLAWIHRS